MAERIIQFPTDYVSLGQSFEIVKHRLDDDAVPLQSKIAAIERIANMPTHNSITKDELVAALRWIFEHYDF